MADPANPRNWGELPDWLIWGCLILACAFEIIGGAVIGEWGRAFAALVIMVGLIGMGFYWRQVRPTWALPSVMTLLIVIALSPYVEQRRWPFTGWFASPSADQIADAVVAKMPPERGAGALSQVPTVQEIAAAIAPIIKAQIETIRQATAVISPAPSPPAPPQYVNPIHDDAIKWRVAQDIVQRRSAGGQKCAFTIVRYEQPYSEDYAADTKDILTVVGWPYTEKFASTTLPRGLSVRAIMSPATRQNTDCVAAIAGPIGVIARDRNGQRLNVGGANLPPDQAPPWLKDCPAGCVEIDIGNDQP